MYTDMDGTSEIELTFADGFKGIVYEAWPSDDAIDCVPSNQVADHFGDTRGVMTFIPFEEVTEYRLIAKHPELLKAL